MRVKGDTSRTIQLSRRVSRHSGTRDGDAGQTVLTEHLHAVIPTVHHEHVQIGIYFDAQRQVQKRRIRTSQTWTTGDDRTRRSTGGPAHHCVSVPSRDVEKGAHCRRVMSSPGCIQLIIRIASPVATSDDRSIGSRSEVDRKAQDSIVASIRYIEIGFRRIEEKVPRIRQLIQRGASGPSDPGDGHSIGRSIAKLLYTMIVAIDHVQILIRINIGILRIVELTGIRSRCLQ